MISNWVSRAGLAALVVTGVALCYGALRRALLTTVTGRQLAADRQLRELAAAVKALEAQVAALKSNRTMVAEPVAEFETTGILGSAVEPVQAPAEAKTVHAEDEVTPETMAVLAAAVTAYMGRKVRILSAKRLQTPRQGMSPWSQQGRVFVQASHNLRARS